MVIDAEGVKTTFALALLVLSAALVAVTVIVCSVCTSVGAL
jgi:hypothetical protein